MLKRPLKRILKFQDCLLIGKFTPGWHLNSSCTVKACLNSTVLFVTLEVNVGLKAKWQAMLQVTMKSIDGLWVAITKSKIATIYTNSQNH